MTPPLTREQLTALIEWHELQAIGCRESAECFVDSTQIRAALNVEVERHTQTVEALRQLAAQDETLETLRRKNSELAGALERLRVAQTWQDIATAPERRKIIVSWVNALGKRRTTFAAYFPADTLDMNDDVPEEDVTDDGRNAHAGWYEEREAGDGEYWRLDEALTHWMPPPSAPERS